ncbi:MAG: flippase-like domain-containing protein [Bacteroidales bacterium]|nr:flippase-like domain-containing protein [Bacteroidales bacterium]
MKKIVFNTIKYLLLFSVGILIFWFLYRKFEWKEIADALKGLNYFWIVLSIIFGLLSQLSRAIRWKMLIKPMGYNPRLSNTFLSVLVLYFANLIIPRAGEVARCGVLAKTDKVPFTKLVGTVFVERLADTLMLFILTIIIFASNFSVILKFFEENPKITGNLLNLLNLKYILIFCLVIVLGIIGYRLLKKRLKKSSKKGRIVELKDQFVAGIKSIASMKGKWKFLGHTMFIFLMWLVMLYVVFLAYEPTKHMTLRAGMVVFLMGGLAMLAPIQGGIGPWHYMVVQTMILYGIEEKTGLIFALIAHSFTNLIYIIFGGIAVMILIFRYGSETIRFRSTPLVNSR